MATRLIRAATYVYRRVNSTSSASSFTGIADDNDDHETNTSRAGNVVCRNAGSLFVSGRRAVAKQVIACDKRDCDNDRRRATQSPALRPEQIANDDRQTPGRR